jgi:hypothetical protein
VPGSGTVIIEIPTELKSAWPPPELKSATNSVQTPVAAVSSKTFNPEVVGALSNRLPEESGLIFRPSACHVPVT